MGATGSGKSTFINLAAGSSLATGSGLRSCTDRVQLAPPFGLHDRSVTLVDTPGFDDSAQSDTDILKIIAVFLSTTYERGTKLAGIVYMHRISDTRVGGTSRRNFKLFRELCGTRALHNVVLVTNMWGAVDAAVGEAREAELSTDNMFFKPVLDKGARLMRHTNTLGSAHAILEAVLDLEPTPLQIQRELVDQDMDISLTAAGVAIGRDLEMQIKQLRQSAREARSQLLITNGEADQDAEEELEEEETELCGNIEHLENKWMTFPLEYKQEKAKMDQMLDAHAEHARRKEEQAEERYQREVSELRVALVRVDKDYEKKMKVIQRLIDQNQGEQGSSADKTSTADGYSSADEPKNESKGENSWRETGDSGTKGHKSSSVPPKPSDPEELRKLKAKLKRLQEELEESRRKNSEHMKRAEEDCRKAQRPSGFFENMVNVMDSFFKRVKRIFGFN
ncbi:hypothetical protein DENSPDRAFT_929114 [Dentipellis sp. KUC8613]|nr:hypothetical protein DENSPDRAFT_929114 [Dentipellis sp. KUC8613]